MILGILGWIVGWMLDDSWMIVGWMLDDSWMLGMLGTSELDNVFWSGKDDVKDETWMNFWVQHRGWVHTGTHANASDLREAVPRFEHHWIGWRCWRENLIIYRKAWFSPWNHGRLLYFFPSNNPGRRRFWKKNDPKEPTNMVHLVVLFHHIPLMVSERSLVFLCSWV